VKKKRQNARGFAREFLRSCKGYGPGRSVKRCSKSSSALEKNFFISEGVLGHLGPLPGSGHQSFDGSISLNFYWKLGYNPSLLIL